MIRRVAIVVAILLSVSTTQGGLIDGALDAVLRDTEPAATVGALVYLADQIDIHGLGRQLDEAHAPTRTRHETVVRAMRDLAAATQGDVIRHLATEVARNEVVSVRPFWIVNAFAVEATPAAIRRLAARPDVDRVFLDHPIELVKPVDGNAVVAPPPPPGDGIEPGVSAVRAPEVWAMGYTGAGVLIANIDTGVEGDHPALMDRWAGTGLAYAGHPEWAWFDPHFGQNEFPYDDGGHGTHTMGTICGGTPGDQVGVAPGAQWIAAGAIDRPGADIETTIANAIASFEWMIDPDGNAATSWDVPRVCSNSWGITTSHGYPECDTTFWSFLDAAEAAGTIVIFAAGNEGADGIRRPADRATDDYSTLAVAAVDGNSPSWPIASFSSRGPTFCTPSGAAAVKPEVAAPGLNVRSAVPGGGYGFSSGTSMASPHACGVMALMLEANPNLTSVQVKQILYDTASDLGSRGDDNTYGHGMIDAVAAVDRALATVDLSFEFSSGRPELVDPYGGTTIRVVIESQSDALARGSAMFHSSDGGVFVTSAMVEVASDEYEAVFSASACGASIEYYFSAETVDGIQAFSPTGAPDALFSADAYSGITVIHADDFETNAGWTVENESLLDGAWERGVPAGGGDRGDPLQDHDGSGACWLTDNAVGNSDVDGGPTRLVSPNFDLAAVPDAVVEYARWFTNDDQDIDRLTVDVSNDGGATWVTIEEASHATGWLVVTHLVADFVTPTDVTRFRFSVVDDPNNSVTEAGLDAFRLTRFFCEEPVIPGDLDGDGDVDFIDLVELLSIWGPCAECAADLDGSGAVDFVDLLQLLSSWT